MYDATRRPSSVVYAALAAAFVGLLAAPARAQFQPRPLGDPATGETFHVEGFAGFWSPTADITISSESLGIIGSDIDLKKDLGLVDTRFSDLRLVLRPAPKHKFRFERTPITYEQSATLTRDIIFNGQRYSVSLPVDSTLAWKAYRFGYEYDFIRRDRGFGGFIVEAKYTDVTATLSNAFVTEYAQARAPIPALGGIARFYPVPNVGVTFEMTGFKLPENINEDYKAHYVDWDLSGVLNVNDYVGGQVGYRSLDLGYLINSDTGSMKLKGLYFGIVARY
jgi:hypothetical protein